MMLSNDRNPGNYKTFLTTAQRLLRTSNSKHDKGTAVLSTTPSQKEGQYRSAYASLHSGRQGILPGGLWNCVVMDRIA